jgi:hypothetical protein
MERIKAVVTADLIEVFETRKEAEDSLDDLEPYSEYFVARNMFEARYPGSRWAVYQVVTVGNEEAI